MEGSIDDSATSFAEGGDIGSVDANRRAKGLARLLIYALLDATDLGSGNTARTVRQAIEQLKSEYGLRDQDILTSGA